MKRIKTWVKSFIIRTIIEDYNANGMVRAIIKSEGDGLASAAFFGSANAKTIMHGSVRAGSAFTSNNPDLR